MSTYTILRLYRDKSIPSEVLREGLTLEEAQEHCHNPETSWSTCQDPDNLNRTILLGPWFDGYVEG